MPPGPVLATWTRSRYSPLRRVPTLVTEDDVVLTDSFVILEAIDDMVGSDRAFLARAGAELA